MIGCVVIDVGDGGARFDDMGSSHRCAMGGLVKRPHGVFLLSGSGAGWTRRIADRRANGTVGFKFFRSNPLFFVSELAGKGKLPDLTASN